jgi:pimeloyl-ACP methyl ester carboxylesterase
MSSQAPSRPWVRRLALLALLAGAFVAVRATVVHLRAASLLLRFADEGAQGALADFGRHGVREELASVRTSHGEARARVYTPEGAVDPPGVILVHGVHRLGIDEPRLMRFARSIAATGVVVLTPQIDEIADYRIDARSVETIGEASALLHRRLGRGKVGVMGMSFAGGLSLLAAAEPRFADDIGFVVAVGAHDDLGRVLRFFATNRVERPDGSSEALHAHEYGALVLVYGRVERFVSAADVPAAREAIRLWLWEKRDEARARLAGMSPAGRAFVEGLFDRSVGPVVASMVGEIDREREAISLVSPHGHLGALRVPVFLLHGAGDTVIPASETLWLASEVPPDELRAALVSPALVHVEMTGEPPIAERWALVHFMAGVLAEAEATR